MIATLILLTATALPASWELRTSVDVGYWRKDSTTPALSLEHCEQMRDYWVWTWGPIVRGERGKKSVRCVRVGLTKSPRGR
jgi:hypothetical protein